MMDVNIKNTEAKADDYGFLKKVVERRSALKQRRSTFKQKRPI